MGRPDARALQSGSSSPPVDDKTAANGSGSGSTSSSSGQSLDVLSTKQDLPPMAPPSSEDVKLNAYKVDLSEAHLYKYVLDFYPANYFSRKEKKQLASRFHFKFETQWPADSVMGDRFEFFLPYPKATLVQKHLQVPFTRVAQKPAPEKCALKCFAPGGDTPVYSRIWTVLGELCDKESRGEDVDMVVPRVFDGQRHCEVSARRLDCNFRDFVNGNDAGSRKDVLDALTQIFQSAAFPVPHWYGRSPMHSGALCEMGSRLIDFGNTPSGGSPVQYKEYGIEVRLGISASTQILGNGIFRVLTPTYGVFFQTINLAELVKQIIEPGRWDKRTIPSLEKLLKGVKVKRITGNVRFDHVVGLGKVPKDQEFVWGEKGLYSVEKYFEEKYGYTVSKDDAHLPCVKVGDAVLPEYLPMTACAVVPAQKADLFLITELANMGETEIRNFNSDMRKVLQDMRAEDNDFGKNLFRDAMNLASVAAFNIKINDLLDDEAPKGWFANQVKNGYRVTANTLTQNVPLITTGLGNKMHGVEVMVIIFAAKNPTNHTELVPALLHAFGDQVISTRFLSSAQKKAPAFAGVMQDIPKLVNKGGIVFGVFSRAHGQNAEVKQAYRKVKRCCEIAKAGHMASISIEGLCSMAAPPDDRKRIGDNKKVGSALLKMFAKRKAAEDPDVASDVSDKVSSMSIGVHVTELESQDQDKTRSHESGPRKYLVTVSRIDRDPVTFHRTQTFLHECGTGSSNGKSGQDGASAYPGIQHLDETAKDELSLFFRGGRNGKIDMTVFRAGVLPGVYAPDPEKQFAGEIRFIKELAEEQGEVLDLSYYTTSSTTHARLSLLSSSPVATSDTQANGEKRTVGHEQRKGRKQADSKDSLKGHEQTSNERQANGYPPSEAFSHKHVSIILRPDFPSGEEWLLQKQAFKDSKKLPSTRPISIICRYGNRAVKDMTETEASAFAAAWTFPAECTSTKELAPVHLARKATRAILRRFPKTEKERISADALRKFQNEEAKYPLYYL